MKRASKLHVWLDAPKFAYSCLVWKKKKKRTAQQYKNDGKERGIDDCIDFRTYTQGPLSFEKAGL